MYLENSSAAFLVESKLNNSFPSVKSSNCHSSKSLISHKSISNLSLIHFNKPFNPHKALFIPFNIQVFMLFPKAEKTFFQAERRLLALVRISENKAETVVQIPLKRVQRNFQAV
jgi:hypothetical protein